jgi:3'-phosphoadenosine 5'-phosphosulfate sulfotransferase (PAPS reductase)/FAD synthetase
MANTNQDSRPDLRDFDWIVVSTSAGKDSQAQLHVVCTEAAELGILDRVVAVHCDLKRAEWAGTRELAERQAARYGVRFEVVTRKQGDLVDHIRARGLWPSSTARYCTSDHKRGQVYTLLTQLAKESREAGTPRARMLNIIGYRAEESPARAKKEAKSYFLNKRASNGRREVWDWYPVISWTETQVWDLIRSEGLESHRAYALGMPRLSCVFCVFAPKAALELAGRHNPELLQTYVDLEDEMGHLFRKGFSIHEVQDAIKRDEAAEAVGTWED